MDNSFGQEGLLMGALDGIRVLDLSRFVAGPYCAMLLGDMGADVVKVERPGSGEDSRLIQPMVNGESLYFMTFNRNKRGITLNFRDPRAQDLLRRLAAEADVLIENFRPGVMEQMGCSWETLHNLNRRLIMARVSGFGQDGPLAAKPCFDVIGQAMGGLMELTGQPGGPPTQAGTFVVDYAAGLYATIGVFAALRERESTGEGQVVDIALLDSATSLLVTAIPEHLLLGRNPTRIGNRDRFIAPANSFETSDGDWIHLMAGSDAHFPRILQAMERPDLLNRPEFSTQVARLEHDREVEAIVAEWVQTLSTTEALARLERFEIPCAKVATIADVVSDPQLQHRGQIVEIDHPVAGPMPTQGNPVRLSNAPPRVVRPAPGLGEHNLEVLSEWIGMSPDVLDELEAARVI
jgi:crotonobetainyl-CoA:carnitine CoA-transferase CaiB-like acyl-CoA transferase